MRERSARTACTAGRHGSGTFRLTVMGTTDLHGNVFTWDYFKGAEYDDATHNDVGLASSRSAGPSSTRWRRR